MSYSFSFSSSEDDDPIAIIKDAVDKKMNNKLIYLSKNENEDNITENKLDSFYKFCKHKKIKQSDYDELIGCIENNDMPDDAKLRKIYNDFKTYYNKSNEIKLNCKFEIVPKIGNESKNECIYVSGAKGSGKSHFTMNYAMKFNKFFPKSPVFLISNKKEEPLFDKIKNLKRIDMNEDTLNDIIGTKLRKKNKDYDSDYDSDDEAHKSKAPYEHFVSKTGQSLVIFDDFEGSTLEKQIRLIIDSISSTGRSSRIYSIIIGHIMCNGKSTKMILNESDGFLIFPHGISPYNLNYALQHYTKMNNHQITKVLDSNARWVYINKTLPNYVVEENGKMWLF